MSGIFDDIVPETPRTGERESRPYCHAWREGFGCCTLLAGHGGTRHVDTFHNRSWPMS